MIRICRIKRSSRIWQGRCAPRVDDSSSAGVERQKSSRETRRGVVDRFMQVSASVGTLIVVQAGRSCCLSHRTFLVRVGSHELIADKDSQGGATLERATRSVSGREADKKSSGNDVLHSSTMASAWS